MDLRSECYAICTDVRETGLFSNHKLISIGTDLSHMVVNQEDLRTTRDGYNAVRFYIYRIERAMAVGFIYDCDNHPSNGCISVPLDSLSLAKDTLPFENRTV